MAKKKAAWNQRSAIRSALRKVWRWSPIRKEAYANAKFARGSYKCQKCAKIFNRKQIAIDHIEKVTPKDWDGLDWTTFVARLFCPASGLQVLCHPCHNQKTKEEKRG